MHRLARTRGTPALPMPRSAVPRVPRQQRSHGWRPEFMLGISLMLQGGATDREISEALGVTTGTLYGWRERNPELAQLMRDSKEGFDTRIERTLAARATGFTYPAERVFLKDGEIIRVQYAEFVPPDTTAMIFWLKNRRPDLWRDVNRRMPEDDVPTEAEQPVADSTKLAMALLDTIRTALKRGEQPPIELPQMKVINHDKERGEADAAGAVSRERADVVEESADYTTGSEPARAASRGATERRHDAADDRPHRARDTGRRRRGYGGDRDEGADDFDLD